MNLQQAFRGCRKLKPNRKIFVFLLGLLISIRALQAQSYEATIELAIVGDSLDVAMYLRHTGTVSPVLGNCSFFINFNKNGLTNPRLKEDGEWDTDRHSGYGQNLLNYSLSLGLASIEVVKAGTPSYQIPDEKTHLGTIRFKIKNPAQNAGITWNDSYLEVTDVAYNDIKSNGTFTNPTDITLPVAMTNFSASIETRGILLTWTTQTEVNSAGFHVWRSEKEEQGYIRLTTALLPSHGNSSSPHEYTFIDKEVKNDIMYWYKIEEISMDGESSFYGPICVLNVLPVPDQYRLSQNYPNPFNLVTTIEYDLPEESEVNITVYSILGQKVKTLLNEKKPPGHYRLTWDGVDDSGHKVPSGIYLLRMDTEEFSAIRKITMMR